MSMNLLEMGIKYGLNKKPIAFYKLKNQFIVKII
jgi:hypothetical protein